MTVICLFVKSTAFIISCHSNVIINSNTVYVIVVAMGIRKVFHSFESCFNKNPVLAKGYLSFFWAWHSIMFMLSLSVKYQKLINFSLHCISVTNTAIVRCSTFFFSVKSMHCFVIIFIRLSVQTRLSRILDKSLPKKKFCEGVQL